MTTTLGEIAKKTNDLTVKIDDLEAYSYRYNLKLVGVPELEDESAYDTANLCVEIFNKIGAHVTLQDIDIAHRVLKRTSRATTNNNRGGDQATSPNAIICKFTRHLPIDVILKHRNRISTINTTELGLTNENSMRAARIYEHLTPKLQKVLYEAKKKQEQIHFKYCWAKFLAYI